MVTEQQRDTSKRTPSDRPRRSRGLPNKRERILEAAVRVFARKGFYASRVREVAQEAGVADGTIYLYFQNKEDLLVTLFRERAAALIEAMEQVQRETSDPIEQLRRVVALQLGLVENKPDLAQVITVIMRQSNRLLRHHAAPVFTKYLETIAAVVENGQRRGIFREELNPIVVARALWGGLDGLAMTWALSDGDPQSLRKAGEHYTRLLLEGLLRRTPGA